MIRPCEHRHRAVRHRLARRPTLVLTTPILLAAIGELISERAGVLNVGLEGMMLVGCVLLLLRGVEGGQPRRRRGRRASAAGSSSAVSWRSSPIEARADQIVSGVGINLAAIGLTSYLFDQVFGNLAQIVVPTLGQLAIPGPVRHPRLRPGALRPRPGRSTWPSCSCRRRGSCSSARSGGSPSRASGELPAAADTAGISVRRVRWAGVLAPAAWPGSAAPTSRSSRSGSSTRR